MLMRPCVLLTCHSTTSSHLSVSQTLTMPRRFYWWIEMNVSTRLWLRRCLKCQARKTSRQTIRWPTLFVPLPNSPGILVSVDYFGPLPLTPRGNAYILLFTDHFSRRADMYTTTEAQFTASSTVDIVVDRYIPLWGCSVTLLSDNGLQLFSSLSLALYDRLGINKIATGSYHPFTNGGVECANNTMTLMLAVVGNEQQTGWDIQLPHVESAYNNSVSAATRLSPNKVHMSRLPRLPLTIFDLPNIGGYQSLNRDQLAYIDLAIARQQRAYRAVRELYAIYVSRLDRRSAPLMDALRLLPPFSINGWAWIYNSAATIRQEARKGTDAIVLKTKLSFN